MNLRNIKQTFMFILKQLLFKRNVTRATAITVNALPPARNTYLYCACVFDIHCGFMIPNARTCELQKNICLFVKKL